MNRSPGIKKGEEMGKKSQENEQEAQAAAPAPDTLAELQEKLAQALAENEALKAKVVAGEEGALNRVAAALGTSSAKVVAAETAKKPEPMIPMFVSQEMNINGRIYRGHVTVPLSVAGVIRSHIGNRQQRILKELTTDKFQLAALNGGFAPHRLSGEM
jgi:hypothetical protein